MPQPHDDDDEILDLIGQFGSASATSRDESLDPGLQALADHVGYEAAARLADERRRGHC